MLKVFNSKTKNLTSAFFLIALSTAFSGILGLMRDRFLASRLGATRSLDIYFAAFRVPDLIYNLLVLGGISIAFVPLFAEAEKEKKSWKFVSNLLNCFLLLFVFLGLVLFLFTPFLVDFVAPGFTKEERAQLTLMTRMLFLSPIFLGISSILSGILRYFQKFFATTLAPIFYNLGIIFGILFLLPIFGLEGLVLGVLFGAFLHLAVQVFPVRNSGFHYLPVFNFRSSFLKKLFRLMIPGVANQALFQLNLIFVTALASTLTPGSIAIFDFANRLRNFPIGIIGFSFAVASLPFLSKSFASGDKKKFLKDFSFSLRQVFFLLIPAGFLLFALRAQTVRLILGTGQFGWWETRLVAASLGIFGLFLLGAGLIPLLLRAFFSLQDIKRPLIAAVVSVSLNIFFCLLFLWSFSFENPFSNFFVRFLRLQGVKDVRIIALPLGLTLSQTIQFLFLLWFFVKRFPSFDLGEILGSLKKIFLAAVLAVLSTYLSLRIGAIFFNTRTFPGLFLQTVLAGFVGILVYVLITFFLKSKELKTINLALKESFIKRVI